jgi:hypothetical protein
MGDNYWPLAEQTVGSHVVSGFASKSDDALRVLLYSHQPRDTQSRSQAAFEIALDLTDVPWPNVRASEYRFDKDHNSYFRLGRELRDRPAGSVKGRIPSPEEVEQLLADLAGGDPAAQMAAVRKATAFSEVPQGLLAAAFELYNKTKSEELRTAIQDAGRQMLNRQQCYRPDEVARIKELSELRVTKTTNHATGADGVLRMTLDVAANGANFVVLEPADKP